MAKTVNSSSPRQHIVQFYQDDAFLCEAVARFLRDGMDGGEAAMVVADERHRRGVLAALRASDFDWVRALARGQLIELDGDVILSTLMRDGLSRSLPDDATFRRVLGRAIDRTGYKTLYRGLRIYGQMVDVLAQAGNDKAALRIEDLWNDLARTHRFQLYCGYSLTAFQRAKDGAAFRRICSSHSRVVPSESFNELCQLDEQARVIAGLQQRAHALDREAAERERLERALREEQERLRDANRRKDEFISLLSHELRNPLAPILTSLDVMDVRGDPSSRREREIIRRQARHLATLVEDLIDVSRIASGKVVIHPKPIELALIADAALEMTTPLIQERQHTLQLGIPRRGLLLEADPVRLPRVLANLLTNAATYTAVGGRISLRAERQGDEISVIVEDNGVGIAPDALGAIFAPFIQGGPSLERAEGGLGLGLTLVRGITQLHGGSVSAFSQGIGKGSRFILRFPALGDPPRRGTAAEPRTPKQAVIASDSQRLAEEPTAPQKILVVDDNRDGAFTLAELLGQLGCEVMVAHDGPSALEIASAFSPTTAFVDIGLPGMDGYALATRLRGLPQAKTLRLIAVTGYSQATDRAKGILAGFDAYVVKPLSLDTVRSMLDGTTALVSG